MRTSTVSCWTVCRCRLRSSLPLEPAVFSGAQIQVLQGSHSLSSTVPFGVSIYGFGEFDSYGYTGGASVAPVAAVQTIDVQPATATRVVNDTHVIRATTLDDASNPIAGVRVDFFVTGTNTEVGFARTNELGVAEFTYSSTRCGP